MTSIEPEPIYIGGQSVYCKFFAMPRDPGEPPRIEGTLTIVGGEGALTLDALVGPTGNPGEPASIIRPQWGSSVTAVEDLPDVATLDDTDDGRAWYIDGQWHIYDNNVYHQVQGSLQGPPGVTPNISVTAEQVEADDPVTYGPITVTETGTSTAPNFHIEIPGIPGPEGPAAAIGSASDFDNTGLAVGKVITVTDDSPETYGLETPANWSPRIYTIPHSSFIDHTGSNSETRFLIASLNIAAQAFDWYPDTVGRVFINRDILSSIQVDIEVRLGDTGVGTGETAPLVGLAPWDPIWSLFDTNTCAKIDPQFSDEANPTRSLTPDGATGRVLAGQAKTVYVFIAVTGGVGFYTFSNPGAQLRFMVVPAAD